MTSPLLPPDIGLHIAKLVAAAPPLTDENVSDLRLLLYGPPPGSALPRP